MNNAASSSSGNNNHGDVSVESQKSDNNNGGIIDSIEKQLQLFLKEAVALYSYLIKKYGEHLKDETSCSSQDDDDEFVNAVVSSLYRMHIYLGDLYRYSNSIQKAEETYVKSSKLYPGTGNPFNQLAVVAQSQESQTVLALYYYARSLMAASLPFETSRPNLVRLFENNLKWIRENDRGNNGNASIMHKSLVGVGKKAQKDWMNKQKVVMTRTVMAKFVELQYALFKGISIEDGDDKVDLNELMEMMEKQLVGFDELFAMSGVSESLLCKILAVLAFSTLGAGNSGKLCSSEQLVGDVLNRGVVMNNQAIAFSFLLRFVALLAKHTKNNIEKNEAAGKIKVGTIRPLSSLLLGVKFTTCLYGGSKLFHGLSLYPAHNVSEHVDTSPIRDLCQQSHFKFWESMADVANCFRALDLVWFDGPTPPECNDVRDFSDFICYVPFETFLTRSSEGKYASLDEAMAALASSSSNTSKSDEDEAIVKIRLILGAVTKATRPASSLGTDETFFLEENPATNTLQVLRDDAPESTVDDMLLDNAGNELDVDESEPKSQYADLGVPLLTPAALLANNLPTSTPSIEQNKPPKDDSVIPNGLLDLTVPQQPKPAQQKPLPPPPGLAPPPGFGGPPVNANSTSASINSNPPALLSLLPQPQQIPVDNQYAFGLNLGTSTNGAFQTYANNEIKPQPGLNLFDTLNPFASSSRQTNEPHTGIDLDFLLNGSLNKSNGISGKNAQTASAEDPYNHGESLLNFLFDNNSSED